GKLGLNVGLGGVFTANGRPQVGRRLGKLALGALGFPLFPTAATGTTGATAGPFTRPHVPLGGEDLFELGLKHLPLVVGHLTLLLEPLHHPLLELGRVKVAPTAPLATFTALPTVSTTVSSAFTGGWGAFGALLGVRHPRHHCQTERH